MKKVMFFLVVSICFSFVFFNNTNSEATSLIQNKIDITPINISTDVTSYFNYITDDYGNNIGANFYVINNSDTKLRVWYGFSGGENVFVSYNGGYADLAPGQEEWAATVTAADPSKAWDSGTFEYQWEPIE